MVQLTSSRHPDTTGSTPQSWNVVLSTIRQLRIRPYTSLTTVAPQGPLPLMMQWLIVACVLLPRMPP